MEPKSLPPPSQFRNQYRALRPYLKTQTVKTFVLFFPFIDLELLVIFILFTYELQYVLISLLIKQFSKTKVSVENCNNCAMR